MNRFSSLCLGAALAPLGLGSQLAAAQASGTDMLTEIIVQGQYLNSDRVNALRSPTPIIDVPQSLSIVTADQIQLQGFNSVGDIINYIPGVNTSQGEGHRDSVVFRGVRSTADFYIDGARDDVQYYRPLYNLEQVEILRGPNALLFGRGGTGGILNRVTKKGVIGENFNTFQATSDTFGEYSIQTDSNLSVSNNSAFRLNAFFESLNNQRDFYDGERVGLNPTAKFRLAPNTIVDLSYEYADHERFIDRGIPTGANGCPVEAFEDIVFGDANVNKTLLKAHLFRAAVQHEFSNSLKGNISLYHGDFDKLYQNFYASSYNQAVTPDVVTLDGYLDATDRQNTILSGNFIWEFSSGMVDHTIVTGGEFIDTSSDQDRFNAFWDTTADDNEIFSIARPLNLRGGIGTNASGITTSNSFASDLNDDTRVAIDVASFYFQDEVSLSENFDVILGARFDSFDIEVLNVLSSERRNRKDEEVTPRFGVVYKPLENISLYASYSESFLPRSGEQYANINGSNNQLDPDTFTNREAGLKWDFSQGLSLTAAWFEIEQSSPQVADNNPETLDVIDSEINGLELQLQGQLIDQWYISAGYSYLDGEQVDRSGPTGLRPRELPEHMFSLWNTWQVTDKLGVSLGLTHQDDSFIDNGNNATLPAYTRVDAAAHYQMSDKLRIQLNIENLTDELYFPNAHSTHQATVAAPVNARLTVSGSF